MRFMRSFSHTIATIVLAQPFAFGQAGDEAKKIYSSSQDSVFLVYLNDSSGTPGALGSAFLSPLGFWLRMPTLQTLESPSSRSAPSVFHLKSFARTKKMI